MATTLQTAPQTENLLVPNEFAQRELVGAKVSDGQAVAKRVTPDEFVQLKIKHAELIDGKVKRTMPTMLSHDRLAFIIAMKLEGFVAQRRLGLVATGGSFRTGESQIRVPDVSFTSTQDLEGQNIESYIQKPPTLAVEIISKNDTYGDVDDKADEFLAAGSQAVWIVNPRRRTVAVHTPDALPQMHNMGDTIAGGEILPGLELPVAAIFED